MIWYIYGLSFISIIICLKIYRVNLKYYLFTELIQKTSIYKFVQKRLIGSEKEVIKLRKRIFEQHKEILYFKTSIRILCKTKCVTIEKKIDCNTLYCLIMDEFDGLEYLDNSTPIMALGGEEYKVINGWGFLFVTGDKSFAFYENDIITNRSIECM